MNRYLVTYETEDEIYTVIETATQIFNKMAMSDCYCISIIGLQWLKEYNNVEDFKRHGYPDCQFKGTWCCKSPVTGRYEPLRMEIVTESGEILDVGYAPNH